MQRKVQTIKWFKINDLQRHESGIILCYEFYIFMKNEKKGKETNEILKYTRKRIYLVFNDD